MRRLGWDAYALAGGLYKWAEEYPVEPMDVAAVDPGESAAPIADIRL